MPSDRLPLRLRRRGGALLLGGAALIGLGAACASQQEAPDAAEPLPPPQQLRGEVGEPVDLLDVEVGVLAIDTWDRSPDGFPRFQVSMRSENGTFRSLRNPDAAVVCDEVDEGGEWENGSTWEANGLLGPGEVNEGIVFLRFPSVDGSTNYPVPTCTNARVVLTATNVTDRTTTEVIYPVDASLVEEAIEAFVGNDLPLPAAPGAPIGPDPEDLLEATDPSA